MSTTTRLEIDLTFSVDDPDADSPIHGTVTADGTEVTVFANRPERLLAGRIIPTVGVRALAAEIAALGLTLSVSGPSGTIATIGAVGTTALQRTITGSANIRLGNPMVLAPLLRATVKHASLPLPPSSPFPPFPTLGRRPARRISTTNYAAGAGRPRLVFVIGSEAWDGTPARVFELLPEISTIGSQPDDDLTLAGLGALRASIRRTDADEYVLTVSSDPTRLITLRTGARIDLGPWRMAYFREEFADHGRPYGGRLGGELSRQRPQAERERTHPKDGSAD